MKSKTSFFNSGIFRKDMTRFFPLWTVYTILLCLICLTLHNDGPASLDDAMQWCSILTYPTAAYAVLCGICVNIDLFDRARCNSLHALPLTRDALFGSHLAAGLLFGLIPNAVLCLLQSVSAGNTDFVFLLAFGVLMLTHFIFFAITEFFVMLSGNAVGAVLLTGFFTFFSLLVYIFVSTLYIPLLEGVVADGTPFLRFSPLTALSQNLYTPADDTYGLCYFVGYGLLALLLLGGAWLLYRKRQLERAGDFLAFPSAAPVLVVLVTPLCGGLGYGFFRLFSFSVAYPFFFITAAVVYFLLWMLLRRSTRVFDWKKIAGCCLIFLFMAGSLVLTAKDVLGISTYIPDTEDIASVRIGNSLSNNPLCSREYIDLVRAAHAAALETEDSTGESYTFDVTYTLKNGKTLRRRYAVIVNGKNEALFRKVYSHEEYVLGRWNPWQYLGKEGWIFTVEGYPISAEEAKGLLDAIAADCRNEAMNQNSAMDNWDGSWLYLAAEDEKDNSGYRSHDISLYVPKDASETRKAISELNQKYPYMHLDESWTRM